MSYGIFHICTRADSSRQHLFRRHAPLILCPTCHGQFSSFRDRDEHVGARICMPQEYRDLLEGHGRLTMEQSEQLRARGRYKDAHDGPAKRWRYIYTVIFPSTPEENIPSPCKFSILCYYCIPSNAVAMNRLPSGSTLRLQAPPPTASPSSGCERSDRQWSCPLGRSGRGCEVGEYLP